MGKVWSWLRKSQKNDECEWDKCDKRPVVKFDCKSLALRLVIGKIN